MWPIDIFLHNNYCNIDAINRHCWTVVCVCFFFFFGTFFCYFVSIYCVIGEKDYDEKCTHIYIFSQVGKSAARYSDLNVSYFGAVCHIGFNLKWISAISCLRVPTAHPRAKFQRNRTMLRWGIDESTNFSRPFFRSQNEQIVLTGVE